jgi:xylulokinase
MSMPSPRAIIGAAMPTAAPGPLVLGVDIGTSSAKGAAFDRAGRCLAAAEVACAYRVPAAGRAEADADTWWRAARDILARLAARVGAAAVEAIGVTGQAPTLLPVDAEGRPLGAAILWLDVRAEADQLAAALGPEAEAVGGNRIHAYYLGPKLAWLRAHAAERFAAAACFLQSHSYPVLRLTGARTTDFASAALSAPLYDARARAWWTPGLAQLGLDPGRLPALRPAHAVAGAVTAAAALETGLRAGTPVVVGGADFAASALAAGVTEPGEAALMLGTAGNLILPFTAPAFDLRLINAHHVGCDRYLALGATLAGAVQQWFRATWSGPAPLEALEREAAAAPAGAGGVRLLPYLTGERTPVWDSGARGAFTGLSLAHGRGHLYRAVLEGVAVSFRHCLEVMRERGAALHEVIAVDGGARSPLWRQILCDALGAPLRYLPAAVGAPGGAALLAALGAGMVSGVEAAKTWRGPVVEHVPESARTELYAGMLAERIARYPSLRRVA